MTVVHPSLAIALVIACIAVITWLISPVLLPFAIAMVMAYLLDPLVDWFEARKYPRGIISALMVGLFVTVVVCVFAVLVPVLVEQATRFGSQAPTYAESVLKQNVLPFIETRLHIPLNRDMVMSQLSAYGEKGLSITLQVLQKTALSTAAFIDVVSLLLITPLVMFYLLRDWDKAKGSIRSLLPRRYSNVVHGLYKKMDIALAAFLRGQFTVCLVQSLFYGVGLWLAGLQMGLLIGAVTGLLTFIPYLGMAFGLITAFGVAVLQFQFNDFTPYLLIATVFGLGQLIESFILTPKLVGDRLGLHPAWVIFALLAGGHVGGFLGVLIALPAAAILNVLVREGVHVWKNSNTYKQTSPKVKPKTL